MTSVFHLVMFFTIFFKYGETNYAIKIFGGESAKPGDLPFIARIQVRYFNWGGTIITEKHIITKANLIKEKLQRPYKEANVTTGSIDFREGHVHHIRHATVHPKFLEKYPKAIRYDVGIITLCKWINFNQHQKPAKLPTREVRDGEKAIIGGWGMTEEGALLPEIMRKITVTAYSVETCSNKSDVGPFDDRSRICTIDEKGLGFCGGDGGNPLMVEDTVIGIASRRGDECGSNTDIYTNVYECLEYIEAEIHPLTCRKPANYTTVRTINIPKPTKLPSGLS